MTDAADPTPTEDIPSQPEPTPQASAPPHQEPKRGRFSDFAGVQATAPTPLPSPSEHEQSDAVDEDEIPASEALAAILDDLEEVQASLKKASSAGDGLKKVLAKQNKLLMEAFTIVVEEFEHPTKEFLRESTIEIFSAALSMVAFFYQSLAENNGAALVAARSVFPPDKQQQFDQVADQVGRTLGPALARLEQLRADMASRART